MKINYQINQEPEKPKNSFLYWLLILWIIVPILIYLILQHGE